VFEPVFIRHPAFKPNKRMQRGIGKLHTPISFADVKGAVPPVATWLEQSGFRAIIPMRMQNQTEGLLCVGDRMGSDELGPTDIEYLSLLSSITIASIFNTRLLKETLEKQHMEEELQLARSIQKGLLPSTLPTIGPYCIYGMNESSLQVGGDYYDVIPVSDHELVIAIGDVSGKGIPASLLMANVQAALRTIAPLRLPLQDATQRLNTIVYRNTGADRFITFFWGVLDTKAHTFEYLNAGHNPPYLVRESGGFVQLNAGGLILGVLPDVPHYDTETVTINPGDTLYMYTDGVNEALSKNVQEYGNERLEHMLDRCRKVRPQELAEAITRDIQKFTAGAGQSDDITMLIIKRQLESAGV
jgi:sigma-B regulation protein RsbU (phosphoserine phosphatase)